MNVNERNLKALAEQFKMMESRLYNMQKELNASRESVTMVLERLAKVEQQAAIQSSKIRGNGPTVRSDGA